MIFLMHGIGTSRKTAAVKRGGDALVTDISGEFYD
jgi:hypothetical protein